MQSVFVSRVSHASNDPRPPIARAESAVTYDPRAVAAKVYVVSALTDRSDPYTVVHDDPPMVAALYVQTGGAYYGLAGVDPWDEERDARNYDGPYPVIAHPPCSSWCQLASVNEKRWGAKIGDDGGTFAAALEAVRKFSGVLEHPAYSLAWKEYGLPRPKSRGGWTLAMGDQGASIEVSQSAYGQPAQKRTWLYAIGCDLPELSTAEPRTLALIGGRGTKVLAPGRYRIQGDKASATPNEFRDVLVTMARSAHEQARERNVLVGSC